MKEKWSIDESIHFFNHGSFGACLKAVTDYQSVMRDLFQENPIRFVKEVYPAAYLENLNAMASFVNSPPTDLVFVPNTTTAVNTVFNSIELGPSDEVLITDQLYVACINIIEHYRKKYKFKLAFCQIPFPLSDEDELLNRFEDKINENTKLAFFDHVSSTFGMKHPISKLLKILNDKGIDSFVDGAHAPAMVEIDLLKWKPTYYAGNCHKWLCSPPGAAFLYVDPSKQNKIHPIILSHQTDFQDLDLSSFQLPFIWTGTEDKSSVLSVKTSIEELSGLFSGGINELMKRNHDQALEMGEVIYNNLGQSPSLPDHMIGSMISLALLSPKLSLEEEIKKLKKKLDELNIVVPVFPAMSEGKGFYVLRFSWQQYLDENDRDYFIDKVVPLLKA